MLSGDLGGCRSPSKLTQLDEALVPDVPNAGAGTTMSASFTEEVTPADQRAADGEESKHDVEDGHGVQPVCGSGNQSNEQRETAESTLKDQTNELVAQLCQYKLTSQEKGAPDDQKKCDQRGELTLFSCPGFLSNYFTLQNILLRHN